MCCSKLNDSAYLFSDVRVYDERLLMLFFRKRYFCLLIYLLQNVVYRISYCCIFDSVVENYFTNETNSITNIISILFQLPR